MGVEMIPPGARFPHKESVDSVPSHEFSPKHRIETIAEGEIPTFRQTLITNLEEYPYSSPAGKQHDLEMRTLDYFKEAFAKPDEWTLLAAKDPAGAIIGALEAKITPIAGANTGFINWVVVNKDFRAQGVALELMQQYEALMRQRGDVQYLFDHIHNTNLASQALHRRFGMSQVFAERPDGRGKWYFKPVNTTL